MPKIAPFYARVLIMNQVSGLFGSPNLQCWGTRARLPRLWNLSSGKATNSPAYSKSPWLCGPTGNATVTCRSLDQVTGFRFRHAVCPTFHPVPCTCNSHAKLLRFPTTGTTCLAYSIRPFLLRAPLPYTFSASALRSASGMAPYGSACTTR